jgi:hypothetical protein
LAKTLRSTLSSGGQVVRGSDGRLTLILDPRADSSNIDYDRFGFQVTVDPSQSFFPVEIRLMRRNSTGRLVLRRLMSVEEFTRLPSGISVPVKATTRFYNTNPGPELGQEDYWVTGEVDVGRSRWNVDLPDETFQLGFPVGTLVHDQVRNIQFVSGSSDPAVNIDQLIEKAKEVLPVGSDEEFQTLKYVWWQDWKWLCGLGVAMLIVGFTIFRLRRKAKTA